MAMRIAVVGTGYVGLVTAACFADLGHDVTGIDVVEDKVRRLNRGEVPIYEPGLERLLLKNIKAGRLRFTTAKEAVREAECSFICVGTPSRKDGSLDLRYVKQAARDIGSQLAHLSDYHVVVMKSTVMPGTTTGLVRHELERASGKKAGKDFGLAMNPEFLKEGMAVQDFLNPDRIIVGAVDPRAAELVRRLYASFTSPVLEVPLSAAEMIKVTSNAFLATKISFVNEVGNVCKRLDIDFRQVAKGMGLDPRIGPLFLRSGCGFGGSCFPKDLKGLIAQSREVGIDPILLQSVKKVNDHQPKRLVSLLTNHISVKGKKVAVLGLAFKPETDDVREASSHIVVSRLQALGAKVQAYDPKAMDNFRLTHPDIRYCSSAQKCVKDAEAVLIVTEWPEFSDPSLYGDKLVIDGRGAVRTKNYEGICW